MAKDDKILKTDDLEKVEKVADNYNTDSISQLTDLEHIRKRPGMYVTNSSKLGLHHLIWELMDNAVDEIANGHGDTLTLIIYKDGSLSVEDNGRGVPAAYSESELKLGSRKKSGLELIYCSSKAGGKFNNENYKFAGGLHGVGASVVTALSEWIEITSKRDGYIYYQKFKNFTDANGVLHCGQRVKDLQILGKLDDPNDTGTLVHFMPDRTVLDTIEWDLDIITTRLQETAYLVKGITIKIEDRRQIDNPEKYGPFEPIVYNYPNNIGDYISYMVQGKRTIHDKAIYFECIEKDVELRVAMQYTDSYNETIVSYVNNVRTPGGGMHDVGFKSGLTKALTEYAKTHVKKSDREKDGSLMLNGDDFREGLVCIISMMIANPEFEGQTKDKLGSSFARPYVDKVTNEKVTEFLNAKGNAGIADAILNKALSAQRARLASKKAKEQARQKASANSNPLLGKLAPATGKKPELNEIFIVEGDSAGGTAKQCRDRFTQAILPLRGKPLNVEKQRIEKILENDEIRTIITAFGASFGDDFNLDNLKYHKVVILADADQDGGHIRSLLMTFFYRYMRPLIEAGHLYIGMPPLYRIEKKDVVKYVYSDAELDDALKEFGKNYRLQRYKGLGEMNADQLWETTMNPETRYLARVNIEDVAQAEKMLTIFMGADSDLRKEYISKHANFNKVDKFERKD